MGKSYENNPVEIAKQAKEKKEKNTAVLGKLKGKVVIDGTRRAGSTKPDAN